MRGLVVLRKGVVFLIAVAVGMASSGAIACPRADSCPDMAKQIRHSCCGGESQGQSAPETKNECPGDCCRPASSLPIQADFLSAEAGPVVVDALLPVAAAVSAPETERTHVSVPDPPDRSRVPVYILASSLLI
jgi:hypothetical protein